MLDRSDVFSDIFARKGNLLTGIEARTKVAFTVIALVINLVSATIYTPVAIAASCLATLLAIGIPPRLLLSRLAMPLVMAAVVLVTQIFSFGASPWFAFPLWGLQIVGCEEGLAHGFLIMWRVIAGVSLVMFLSLSTPADRLLLAARWFRLPRIFIELALLIYRYVFVLVEEMTTIKSAQKVRLGYRGWSQSMKSLGVLGGSLVLRAYDRAERVFAAMLARGYTGTMTAGYRPGFGRKDYLAAGCLGVVLVVFYMVGRIKV